ncbi:hypothetical protein EJ110_NYTH56556 [Nymphaea thermarum]|nr:hypothetical protein EJ110_NYTH56556 [Nymphaea thermarum]
MQRLMQIKFVPSNNAERAYKKYFNLCQGSRSVADYTAEFHRLTVRVQIGETECQQVTSQVKQKLQESYETYKNRVDRSRRDVNFEVGQQVWVYLRPERCPLGTYSKLSPRKYGPFRISHRLGTNVYLLELPEDWQISPIFNVSGLFPYSGNNDSSETNSLQLGENDAGQDQTHHSLGSSSSPQVPPSGISAVHEPSTVRSLVDPEHTREELDPSGILRPPKESRSSVGRYPESDAVQRKTSAL